MITLFSAGEGFGLPEYSPYGMKTDVQLQLADLPYVKVTARPQGSPKGQLPWIEDEGELIADSTFIRAHIEGKYGIDIDAGLTREQRAVAWAFERMVENHLGWASAWARFMISENFDKGPGRWFDAAPAEMRETMRTGLMEAVRTNLTAVGILRHSDEEILWLAERSLTAIAVQLGDKPSSTASGRSGRRRWSIRRWPASSPPSSTLRCAARPRPCRPWSPMPGG